MFHEHLQLDSISRRIVFPFRLLQFSYSRGLNAGKLVRHRGTSLEFCLRFSSTEESATDIFDGVSYCSHFPYLLFKLPGVEHLNRIRGVREALSLYYPAEQMGDFERAGFCLAPPGRPVAISPEVLAPLGRMRELLGSALVPGVAEQLDLLAFQLLTQLFIRPGNEEEPCADAVRRIASHLHLHFTDKIELEPLLRRHGLSRRTFFRRWREIYELPPAEYLKNLRFEEACRLLRESGLSVDEIIARTGFADRTCFFHRFRERTGLTPAEFRAGRHSGVRSDKNPA